MSKHSDAQRHEERVDASIERARRWLGFWGLVLAHYAQGLTSKQSAEMLGTTADQVWYARKKKLGLAGPRKCEVENGKA